MTTGIYDVLEAVIRSARISIVKAAAAETMTGTEIVACEDLLPPWSAVGPARDYSHEAGEPCTHVGQSWRCCQAHNSRNNPDIVPGGSPAHWVPYHTTDPARAKPFIQPTGAHDSYMPGEVCLWPPEPDAPDRKVYRSILPTANSYSPADYPDGWEIVATA